jgi:XTP/dITP diphosphohydrolase
VQWIIATRSRGKLAELTPLLAARGIDAIGLDDARVAIDRVAEDAIEVFDTFEANALAKARYFVGRTGQACIADDSGLCVDALNGQPGVRSRRFARDLGIAPSLSNEDDANNQALLDACWDSGRAPPWLAHFACAAAYVDAHRSVVTLGRTEGAIIPDRVGDSGFGYDPFFRSDDLGVTFAVASREAKARVSHRARAFASLLALVLNENSATSAR